MQNSRSGPVQRGDALAVHEFSLKSLFRLRAAGVRERGMKNLLLFALRRPTSLLMAVPVQPVRDNL